MGRAGRFGCACLALLFLSTAAPAGVTDIDWTEVEREAAEWLRAYIRIDTTNPPGQETAAASFLAEHFRQSGVEAETFEPAPGRGSVLARVKGNGTLRPVILLNHLDVVAARPEGWDLPPFEAGVRDGYIYGRGAIDCKGPGIIEAMTLVLLKRHHIALQRDVIFLGTADEEAGGRLGAGWMTAEHIEKLRHAEFVINEGGGVRVLPNGSRVYEVAIAEKTPCWLKLQASGTGGHGSAPPPETAVTRLIRALGRLRAYETPVRVTPEVQAYYTALASTQSGDRVERYKDLHRALEDSDFRRAFLQNPHDAALVRNTITPTVLNGSSKTNVIPQDASAEIDCRLLPGEDADAFVRTVREIIADREVDVSVLLSFPEISSPLETTFTAAVRKLAYRDHATMIPSVLTGFTDSHYFREKGIASYGFIPFDMSEAESAREHGPNERLSVRNLGLGTRRLIELLQLLDTEATAGER